jgi:hypothetical protein
VAKSLEDKGTRGNKNVPVIPVDSVASSELLDSPLANAAAVLAMDAVYLTALAMDDAVAAQKDPLNGSMFMETAVLLFALVTPSYYHCNTLFALLSTTQPKLGGWALRVRHRQRQDLIPGSPELKSRHCRFLKTSYLYPLLF